MWWMLFVLSAAAQNISNAPAANQIILFKQRTKGPIGIMTTSAGAPIEYLDATTTLNRRLLFNEHFTEGLTHLNRERLPERVVHANGAGAFGYFEVTHDITDICKAKLFSKVGKKTPIAVRFSTIFGERGSSDTARDGRGFAVKFYTEEGNFDIVGSSAPMFAFSDPILFPSLVRALKKNPATNLFDPNMFWDALTLNPETLHMFLIILSDRGIPRGYRHMPGYSIHTYQVVNKKGESYFVRFHFVPDAGVQNIFSEEAVRLSGIDPDYATRDLYRAIGVGAYPSWKVYIQKLSLHDVKTAAFNVFDVTRILPLKKYPLHPVGRLVLKRNPLNYHAEVEQLAFCPGNLVPGILGGPDKMFEARRLAYRDTQNYRLGVNFKKIEVNCPFRTVALTYNRDGVPPVKDNEKDVPVYYPNSFHGPIPYVDKNRVEVLDIHQSPPDNFDQMHDLYEDEFSVAERGRLAENILYVLRPVARFLQERTVNLFKRIHPDLGSRIEQGLAANATMG